MLSVYTRHSADCKHYGDKLWRRCNCPKWIWGSHNGEFHRLSAKTRLWDEAEQFRYHLENPASVPPQPVSQTPPIHKQPTVTAPAPVASVSSVPIPTTPPQKPRVTIERAVESYLSDARSRELKPATLSKLETIFRKQFLAWTRVQGLKFLDQLDLDTLLSFRSTWKDGGLAKQKKHDRLIGFFWAGVRRG